jgi:hypothetical protein
MLPIVLALAFIAILIFIIIAGCPDEFMVMRSEKISAPPDKIFPRVNELRNWEAWNPWGKMDPNCKMIYDGPPAGIGAGYTWAGNKKVGEGRLTITGSRPSELVQLKLEFLKPFKATNAAEFTFRSDGNQTAVTWSMSGKNSFFFKAFSLFMDCDKMVGGDFEKGLAAMKSAVETAGKN